MKKISIALAIILISISVSCSISRAQLEPAYQSESNGETVVLIHGLGRSNVAMWSLASRLEDAGYRVERVGYSSLNQTPEEIVNVVSQQIDECCADIGKTVNFVGHSLGGLLIRAYLQNRKIDNLGRVVLIGTPNQGTAIVDKYKERWWMALLGPTTAALGTDDGSFPKSLAPPYYPVGVIAGFRQSDMPDEILPGKDDGLVAIESTKLEGMGDFIIIESGHSMMRYNDDVAKQTISFLKNGRFAKASVGEE